MEREFFVSDGIILYCFQLRSLYNFRIEYFHDVWNLSHFQMEFKSNLMIWTTRSRIKILFRKSVRWNELRVVFSRILEWTENTTLSIKRKYPVKHTTVFTNHKQFVNEQNNTILLKQINSTTRVRSQVILHLTNHILISNCITFTFIFYFLIRTVPQYTTDSLRYSHEENRVFIVSLNCYYHSSWHSKYTNSPLFRYLNVSFL